MKLQSLEWMSGQTLLGMTQCWKRWCMTLHSWWTLKAVATNLTLTVKLLRPSIKDWVKLGKLFLATTADSTHGLSWRGTLLIFQPLNEVLKICSCSRYDFSLAVAHVVYAITIPNGLFLISLIVLLYWYCPYCQARCRKYEEQTDQDIKEELE